MDLGLKNKKAVVSGSTAGIGLAIATELAAEGASVVVNGRTAERVTGAMDAIRKRHPTADLAGVAADLATADGVRSFVEQVPAADILINNLGIFEPKPFMEITDADWLRFFEANVLSGIRLSRAYIPSMQKKNWGRIIFISSESAVQIPAEMMQYGMTKTAQLAVARGLAEMLTGTAVTVNSVLAGPTASEGVGKFIEQIAKSKNQTHAQVEKEFFTTMRPTSIIRRLERTEEIAAMVAYLAGERASATTGSALRVDGGVVRSIV